MNKYENVIILKTNLSEKEIKKTTNKIKEIIENNGGRIDNIEKLGKKKLAYEIKGQNEGIYQVHYFIGEPNTNIISKLEKQLRMDDNVIKFIDIKLEDYPEIANEIIARNLYDNSLDMDWADYEDTKEEDIAQITRALNKLESSRDEDLKALYKLLEMLGGE